MTQTQSNYATNDRQPATGAFLALLASTEPKSLKQLIIDGLNAIEERRAALNDPAYSEAWGLYAPERLAYEARCDRAETRCDETRQALLDHLLFEHGVGGSLASRIGEVI